MSNFVELAKKFDKAATDKDVATITALLHPQYTAQCALAKVNSKEEALEYMQACPLKFRNENSTFVSEGTTVVQLFDWVIEAPFQAKTRVVRVFRFEGEQIRTIEMIYDTAVFPTEFLAEIEKVMKEKALATA